MSAGTKTRKRSPKRADKKKARGTQLATSPPKQLAPAEQFCITLRGLKQPASEGRTFGSADPATTIAEVLECKDFPGREPRFNWQGKSRACVVDVDFHGAMKPLREQLEQVVRRLPVQPLFWWISHGGGLKLVYVAADEMTAEEIGELAAHLLEIALKDAGLTGTEVKSDTRHPLYPRGGERCSEVFRGGCSDLAAAKRKMFSEYSEDDFDHGLWEQFLEERGWTIGQRLPHEECRIDPQHQSKSDSVIAVNDTGLYCFSCAGREACLPGMTTAGAMPARYLMDGSPLRTRNNLFYAVKFYAHFEQSRWNYKDLPEKRARIRHRATLKLFHTVDVSEKKDIEFAEQQIRRVFDDFGLLRIQGQFCDTVAGQPDMGIDNRARGMPFCLYKSAKGKAAVDCVRLGHLQSRANLDRFGYGDLIPLRGIDLAATVREMRRDWSIVPDNQLFAVFAANPPARLRTPVTKGELDGAFEHVGRLFPGISPNYVLLGIAAKGVHQLSLGVDVARSVVTGPTGAGKTRTIQLAAVLTGEEAQTPQFTKEQDRTKRSYAECSLKSTFVVFDEFEKASRQMEAGLLLDLLLFFERGAQFHKLHKGGESITLPGAVFITSPHMPQEMLQQPEVCRRWVHVDLTGPAEEVDWFKSCGTDGLENWLTRDITGANRRARDTIVSWVIQQYFSTDQVWRFKDIAADLGFKTLAESAENNKQAYVDLNALYGTHTPYKGADRWPESEQWRVIDRNETGEFPALFSDITKGWSQEGINALRAVPWAAYLKTPGLRLRIKRCGKNPDTRLGLRFCTE